MTARAAVVSAALALYCAGIIALALLPWPPDWLEIIVAAIAALALVGLVAHLVPAVRLPGEQWAYLGVSFAGAVTFAAFELATAAAPWARLAIGLLLAAGVVGAAGAHLGMLARQEVR